MATLIVNASPVTDPPPSRAQQISFFLQSNLRARIAWMPDELVMLSGYFPFWGASLLIYFAHAEPVLFVPQIEPRDHTPAGLRVQEYPWGDLQCRDPCLAFVSAVGDELVRAKIEPQRAGMNRSSARTPLPIQAAEQIPIPEGFAGPGDSRQPHRRIGKGQDCCPRTLGFLHPPHGHDFGLRYHEMGFLILFGESASLEPGMVTTIEPGLYVSNSARAQASRTTCWSPNPDTRSFPDMKVIQTGQTIGVDDYDQH